MEGKGSFVILLAIVAVLTLTLAVLAGYLFIMGGPNQPANTAAVQQKEVPDSKHLNRKQIYGEDPELYNLKPEMDGKLGILQLNAELVYFKKLKGVKNSEELLDVYIGEIKEAITEYFLCKSYTEISQEDGLQKAKSDLKNKINSLLKKKESILQDPIWEVVISKWNIQSL